MTIDLSNAAQAVFKKYPNIKLVDIQDAKFDRATAQHHAEPAAGSSESEDHIQLQRRRWRWAPMEALKKAGKLDRVVVGGIDGNQDALKAIKARWKRLCTRTSGCGLHRHGSCSEVLDGQKLDEKMLVDCEAVTPANVDKYLK